ncbi:RING finger protein 141-like isoform X2 [Anthonomus grandis grandis]|uniref:RING finger protein 141-like isoform X2 n=1 Tax=Anthonomus grandis grandis TaxID=2921223 RepID=UPI002166A4EF|nr:RING finger protein 141-like isoform X2 [Anthonomus grandis grandis]
MGDVVSQVVEDQQVNTLLTQEICNLSYEDLLSLVGELNILSQKCLDTKGNQLIFAVKKGSDSTVFWKATVQIACCRVDTQTQKVQSYRLLNLGQFLKVFKTFQCQVMAAEQCRKSDSSAAPNPEVSFSTILQDTVDSPVPSESPNECIICFERKQDITLPCAHSYCTLCIEEWNESHDTCPICRERLDSPSDTWVISEVPKAEEISDEIRDSLLELSEEKNSICTTS